MGYKEAVNSDSFAFKITYKKSSFWFLNDLKKAGMKDLIVGKKSKAKKADFYNSVVLIPHHGIFNNGITEYIQKDFEGKFAGANMFVRSVDKKHYRPTAAKKQEQFMKMFTNPESKLSKKELLETCVDGSFTISTTGTGNYTEK